MVCDPIGISIELERGEMNQTSTIKESSRMKRLAQVIIPMALLLMGWDSNVGMDVNVAWGDDSNFYCNRR